MQTAFADFILNSPRPIAMPIGLYAGLEIIGGSVREAATDPEKQRDAALALHERFDTPVMLTAMDLSVEAEAFGCRLHMTDDETPTVIGRLAAAPSDVDRLPAPSAGDGRTRVYLEAARLMVARSGGAPVLGGLTGPLSLAGRIFGMSETLEGTLSMPETVLSLLEKATAFLTDYALAFRAAGAAGVIVAEPAAGLLSPRGMARFSSAFLRRIVADVQTRDFAVVLHNCGARNVHLKEMLQSGPEIVHVGALMDMAEALRQADGRVILCGNLDPIAVFHDGLPDEVYASTIRLLRMAKGYPAFVLSSGCDLPPRTPLVNLESFYRAARGE
ncbi:MAG: uroporphyrinogen decarboxylase family protein [Vicinamibacteria bacterium]|nr:uroporphyrinogen decarboxylase family protein [Vicinamibacteria bacterium]